MPYPITTFEFVTNSVLGKLLDTSISMSCIFPSLLKKREFNGIGDLCKTKKKETGVEHYNGRGPGISKGNVICTEVQKWLGRGLMSHSYQYMLKLIQIMTECWISTFVYFEYIGCIYIWYCQNCKIWWHISISKISSLWLVIIFHNKVKK